MTCRLIHLCSLFCLASWAWLPGAVAAPGDAQGGAAAPLGITQDTLTVTRQRLCRGEISPYQCGQFIEYLCA